ncbi:Cys/Met metabolism pyridoxal phosphate-dependent enzyme [Venturia nashicola]|uniref:Cys/Met metabolism pyridoxal phosphate-dependent enzyme n=1 Tax=Venturia nashicola TaxID=86259 RepID=A0A4Z1P5V0_9PEZI|nr:Cys/Met metabolism pyridoxal phosphate-dependent enzyme [Venturia nashicola]TLD34984.1 Cys/Met metabolism pyridoxal phosphate-dependent enzyme [Venturia nashicola]
MPIFPANNGDPPMAPAQTQWLKRVLIPFWVIRVLAMALYEVTYIVLLVIIAQNESDTSRNGGRGGYIALRPKTFLIFQVIETTIWVVLVILSIVGLAQISGSRYRRPAPLAYILQIILLISFVALLIYASIIYHRARKASRSGGGYAPASTGAGAHDPEYHGAAGTVPYDTRAPPSNQNPFASPYDPSLHNLSAQPSMEMGPAQLDRAAQAPEVVTADNRSYNAPAPKLGAAELPTYDGHGTTRYA